MRSLNLSRVSKGAFDRVWRWRVVSAILVVVCVFGVELALLNLPQANAAYTISNSARFISGNSDNLSKTFAGAGNRQTWTFSAWIKRADVSTSAQAIFSGGSGTSDALWSGIWWGTDLRVGGYNTNWRVTNVVFRDSAKWYHIVVAFDATQTVANDRIKVYVDGTQITSFATLNNPSQNTNYGINLAALHNIGYGALGGLAYPDQYMADTYFVDGQALEPTSFGEIDSNGYWRPKAYSGTYGTNGFKLAFGNGASLGTDTSGNANSFTASGLASTDQMYDTPTNSFATWNTIYKGPLYATAASLTNGNSKATSASSGAGLDARATVGARTGKYYFEATIDALPSWLMLGVTDVNQKIAGITTATYGQSYFYNYSGTKYTPSGANAAYGASYTVGDVIGVALNMDSGTVEFFKNNTSQGVAGTGLSGEFTAQVLADNTGSPSVTVNFGQGGQSGLTYDSASGGYFKYTPPSGYKALSTNNLPEPSIVVPKNYFDAVTYTGTGATLTVFQSGTSTTITGFTPDLVWLKDRSATNDHGIFDSLRGAANVIKSNANTAEVASSTSLTAFASNGFTLGADGTFNTSAHNYVSWLWKESATAGFDIVTYTGDGTSDRAISHALGAAPDMVIVKRRDSTGDPYVWHSSFSGATAFALLDSTAATSTSNSPWGTGSFGASTFMVSANATNNLNSGAGVGATTTVYLTSGTSWTVPSDWNSSNNTIEVIGGGGGGGSGNAGGGGGGGYSKVTNTTLTGGGSVAYAVGSAAGDTYFCTSTSNCTSISDTAVVAGAKGGTAGDVATAGTGGSSASGVGTVKYSGGAGGTPTVLTINPGPPPTRAFNAGGGGGGAGPSGNGVAGSNGSSGSVASGAGGAGDNGSGGAGGSSVGANTNGNPGSSGTEFDASHGAGGGGSGSQYTGLGVPGTTSGGAGGAYGAGGGGGSSTGGAGSQGLIIIKYAPTSTAGTYVAYLFKGIDGFSKFGSYTGNGSADGPFIYTGFKPRYVMIKRADSTSDWWVYDTSRDTYNPVSHLLYGDLSSAENTGGTNAFDLLSNGFKLRDGTSGGDNTSGATFIYAAFAEQPFYYSAQSATASSGSFVQAIAFLMGMTF